jgi:hypothetical protein
MSSYEILPKSKSPDDSMGMKELRMETPEPHPYHPSTFTNGGISGFPLKKWREFIESLFST